MPQWVIAVAQYGPVILDEVHRGPKQFRAIKLAVDHRRVPGLYLVAGSSNVPLGPQLSASLAGRLPIVRSPPLAIARAGLERD